MSVLDCFMFPFVNPTRRRNLGMKCPNCGTENVDQAVACQRCGTKFAGGFAQPIGPPLAAPAKKSKVLWIVAIVLVVIVVVGILAAYLLMNSATLSIVDFEATYNLAGDVNFVVQLENLGTKTGTSTLVCKVTFSSDGMAFENSRSVTLGAGESNSYTLTVDIPIAYILDTTGTAAVFLT